MFSQLYKKFPKYSKGAKGIALSLSLCASPLTQGAVAMDAIGSMVLSEVVSKVKAGLTSSGKESVSEVTKDDFNQIVRERDITKLNGFAKEILQECLELEKDKRYVNTNVPEKAATLHTVISYRFSIAELILNYMSLFDAAYDDWGRALVKEEKLVSVGSSYKMTGISSASDKGLLEKLKETLNLCSQNLTSAFYYHYRFTNGKTLIERATGSLFNKVWRTVETGGSPVYAVPETNINEASLIIRGLLNSENDFKHYTARLYDLYCKTLAIIQMPEEEFMDEECNFFSIYREKYKRYDEELRPNVDNALLSGSPMTRTSSGSYERPSLSVLTHPPLNGKLRDTKRFSGYSQSVSPNYGGKEDSGEFSASPQSLPQMTFSRGRGSQPIIRTNSSYQENDQDTMQFPMSFDEDKEKSMADRLATRTSPSRNNEKEGEAEEKTL